MLSDTDAVLFAIVTIWMSSVLMLSLVTICLRNPLLDKYYRSCTVKGYTYTTLSSLCYWQAD
ncbi:hypothetical protein DSUL_50457 [Desulfovibrionales bacterium]